MLYMLKGLRAADGFKVVLLHAATRIERMVVKVTYPRPNP